MNRDGRDLRFEQAVDEIHSERMRSEARLPGDLGSWSRRRDMPLEDILMCTLAKKGLSTVMEVRQYFQAAEKVEQTVSKQDYLRQRQKLNPEVFRLLNRNYLRRFYEGDEAKCWHGYLLMAIDGSRAEIPNSPENRLFYGESENQHGKAVARANLSVLQDLVNGFMVDIKIQHYRGSEIEGAKAHIVALKEIVKERPVLILFDRNYASLEFFDYLEKAGVKYLIRLHKRDYQAEIEGMKGNDEEVELEYTKGRLAPVRRQNPQRARELSEQGAARVRILKGVLTNGERVTFATNMREGTGGQLQRLYRKRWLIEQRYHTLKNKMKFESVTGKASIYVAQDFWAQVFVFNLVQDLILAAEYRAAKKAKKKRLKYEVKINENIAIGLFKDQMIRLMLEEDEERKEELFRRLGADMERNVVPVRKMKSSPRRWKFLNKYQSNLKPTF